MSFILFFVHLEESLKEIPLNNSIQPIRLERNPCTQKQITVEHIRDGKSSWKLKSLNYLTAFTVLDNWLSWNRYPFEYFTHLVEYVIHTKNLFMKWRRKILVLQAISYSRREAFLKIASCYSSWGWSKRKVVEQFFFSLFDGQSLLGVCIDNCSMVPASLTWTTIRCDKLKAALDTYVVFSHFRNQIHFGI